MNDTNTAHDALDPTSSTAAPAPELWRSLEELTESPEFREMMEREFPDQAAEWTNPVSRRQFLMLMGASLSLAGLSGCIRPPIEKIVPYVNQPVDMHQLGKPLFYATAMPLAGYATGLLVETHEGRPTKIEGNPSHPASLGATSALQQASILTMYDPDRSQVVTEAGRVRSTEAATAALRNAVRDAQGKARKNGAGLRILSEATTSPTVARLMEKFRKDFPEAKWVQYEPCGSDAAREGATTAFGEDVNCVYDFSKVDRVLSLDADFLGSGPGHVRYARDFATKRRVLGGPKDAKGNSRPMGRMYMVESTTTATGFKADHRLAVRPSEVEVFARAVAAKLGVSVGDGSVPAKFGTWNLDELVKDLKDHEGRCLVVPGDQQSPMVHALAHAMNAALKNVGKTVTYTQPAEVRPAEGMSDLKTLVKEMEQGTVEVLLILGGNPVYNAPFELKFGEALETLSKERKLPTFHLSLYHDETSRLCRWHIPEAHYLETWGDARAYDGTVTIMQPMIAPLYGGKSAIELLSVLTEPTDQPGATLVRETWRQTWEASRTSGSFDIYWKQSLFDGMVPGTRFTPKQVAPRGGDWASKARSSSEEPPTNFAEIVFRPDPALFDGRFANNGWLQEMPKPVSKLTWGNAVFLSELSASALGIKTRFGWRGGEHGEMIVDMLKVEYRGQEIIAPAFIQPGHPEKTITVHLGHGREVAGRVGSKIGFNAYTLRHGDRPWFDEGAKVSRDKLEGQTFVLACTQGHHAMGSADAKQIEGRHILRHGKIDAYRKDEHFVEEMEHHGGGHGHDHDHEHEHEHEHGHEHEHPEPKQKRKTLMLFSSDAPNIDYKHKWGMAIDLTACTGCSACVVACQSENNIPVVGKDQVVRGREMHWLRIDRYFGGNPADTSSIEGHFQPVPCMQCENAPCELVCPVEATNHSYDGLNDMIYNRCVGTRYCSNNCPYKVRRFNFLFYADYNTQSLKLQRNPEVTVRSRGVMEKCTYCVQRIRYAEIEAEKRAVQPGAKPGDDAVRDGEILTACQQACPSGAIVFGDMKDEKSKVAQWKKDPLNYTVLDSHLNTRPRTSYLAELRNPNPDLERA